jgi:predicted amidohydrolase
MFQSHVAVVTANQSYGSGTMIGEPPTRILARCPDREESYSVATVNLEKVRKIRTNSRNFQQRRPDLYGDLVKPLPKRRG